MVAPERLGLLGMAATVGQGAGSRKPPTRSRTLQTVATVSKRWFSMRDTYAVDVAADQDDLLLLASVLALDLAEDQERAQH